MLKMLKQYRLKVEQCAILELRVARRKEASKIGNHRHPPPPPLPPAHKCKKKRNKSLCVSRLVSLLSGVIPIRPINFRVLVSAFGLLFSSFKHKMSDKQES